MIGTRLQKPIENVEDYAVLARWCNENQTATLEEFDDYYEVVAKPEPTAEELVEQAIKQAKADRAEAVASITVEVDGMVFDGDETSQDRMARAITMFNASGLPSDTLTTWVLADSSIAQVSISQLAQALLKAGQKQTELWTKPYESGEAVDGTATA